MFSVEIPLAFLHFYLSSLYCQNCVHCQTVAFQPKYIVLLFQCNWKGLKGIWDQKKVRIKAEDVKCRCPSTWVPPEPWAPNQKPANSHLIKFDQWDVEQSFIENKHGTMGIDSKAPPGDAGGREAGRSQTLQVRLTNPLAKLLVQEQRRCHHLIPNSYLRNVLPLIEDEDPAVVGTLPSCSWECHIPNPLTFKRSFQQCNEARYIFFSYCDQKYEIEWHSKI